MLQWYRMQYRDRRELEDWIADVRERRRSVHPREVHRVLVLGGFDRRPGKGDHWIYRRGGSGIVVIDPRIPLLPAYVSAVIRVIEEILREEG